MDVALHPREADRLLSLEKYGLPGTEDVVSFDTLTRRAAQACGAPIAMISVVERRHQWYLSRFGEDPGTVSRTESVCSDAVASAEVLVVNDLTRVSRYAALPSVTRPHGFRAYAGVPLVGREGLPLGTLCVLDTRPREFTEDQVDVLRDLAHDVVVGLEQHRDEVAGTHAP